MIQPITSEPQNIKIKILPELETYDELSLSPGDTIVISVDRERYDLDAAQEVYKLFGNTFPKNNILVLFDGIEIKGIIKEKGDYNGANKTIKTNNWNYERDSSGRNIERNSSRTNGEECYTFDTFQYSGNHSSSNNNQVRKHRQTFW